ncbi:hypothetical protein MBAV_004985 [Candidatus Magnetobacterium bavaricum]|uniref:PIN domain-containing protein n=1 Tax=Candidatus Magnetobacterium bavaricum TaxID=29290 RepID=A0A0F3GLX9_9BACT|nr:hypothetical protein MBAV_004985 [Candidatus Magnetobacterium bavaricum]
MCVVIDTNTFSSVFNRNSSDHHNYKPVLDWILKGKGVIVYGGKKYKDELKEASKYLEIFIEFKSKRKALEVPAEDVDKHENYVNKFVKNPSFNDAHLVAIIRVSRCKIICTEDDKAIPFIKENNLYPKGCEVPKIYAYKFHEDMLCDSNIVNFCKKDKHGNKIEKLNKKDRAALDRVLGKS